MTELRTEYYDGYEHHRWLLDNGCIMTTLVPQHRITLSDLRSSLPAEFEIEQRVHDAHFAIAEYIIEWVVATIRTVCGLGDSWDDANAALARAITAVHAAHPSSLAAVAGATTEADYYQDQDAQ